MSGILEFIAQETGGKIYKSHRFCFDAELKMPSLAYDDNQEFTLQHDKIGETDTTRKTTKDLTNYAKQIQAQRPLFTYFLDGSRRVYKVDDIEYSQRLFPAIGGQIGVACCRRTSPEIFEKIVLESHLILSLPRLATSGQQHEKHFLGRVIQQINQNRRLQKFKIRFDEVVTYSSDKNESGKKEEYMDRGTATVQDKMIEFEKKVVDDLAKRNYLNQDNYLIKDGSLQYSKTSSGDFRELAKYRSNYRRVVGVSKSFNPETSKDKRGQSNAANIANLKPLHRTPAARFQYNRIGNVFFSVWYVRIRETKYTESPFAGVLKIEKVLVTDEEIENGVDSQEVDLITANIINERFPVCYGKDQRWANHLYPIYLTETYIKSKYLSDFHFINLF
jgi:hypothetical protein